MGVGAERLMKLLTGKDGDGIRPLLCIPVANSGTHLPLMILRPPRRDGQGTGSPFDVPWKSGEGRQLHGPSYHLRQFILFHFQESNGLDGFSVADLLSVSPCLF